MIDTGSADNVAAFPGPVGQPNDLSGRSLVLCSATRLEQKLGEILREFLMSGAAADRLMHGPLASLPARALACHSLALISEDEFTECELVSRISEEFHRSAYASFASETIAPMCRKLRFRNRRQEPSDSGGQEQFCSAVSALLRRLANRAFYIGGEKRVRRNWPNGG
jgi:hypothetical protein